jgi:hypothetical protein
MLIAKRLTCLSAPLGSQKANQPRRHPGSMNLFDRAPMLITGAMCAKEAMGTNLLPPKTICAYTSSAMNPQISCSFSNLQDSVISSFAVSKDANFAVLRHGQQDSKHQYVVHLFLVFVEVEAFFHTFLKIYTDYKLTTTIEFCS